MKQHGGRRPRHMPAGVTVFVSTGRWGRKRARVEQCAAVLAAELVYGNLICEGVPLAAGWRAVGSWAPHGETGPSWQVTAELVPNAVWRRGRLFLRCANCQRLGTRLYVPILGLEPRCRRCWGLAYVSQTWSYKPSGWLGKAFGPNCLCDHLRAASEATGGRAGALRRAATRSVSTLSIRPYHYGPAQTGGQLPAVHGH